MQEIVLRGIQQNIQFSYLIPKDLDPQRLVWWLPHIIVWNYATSLWAPKSSSTKNFLPPGCSTIRIWMKFLYSISLLSHVIHGCISLLRDQTLLANHLIWLRTLHIQRIILPKLCNISEANGIYFYSCAKFWYLAVHSYDIRGGSNKKKSWTRKKILDQKKKKLSRFFCIDECHTKIDLFELKKIGEFLVFKIGWNLSYSKYSHIFDIKITKDSSIFQDIIPLFDIPDSIPTMIG